MATITAQTTTETQGDQCVVTHFVDWKGYLTMLRLRGERSRPRMFYLDGELFLMSTTFLHEHLRGRLADMIMEVVVELDIPCIRAGSTTFRRRKKRAGGEADQSTCLANAARIAGKTDLHLRHDPPPDLVIEVVDGQDAEVAVEVWRRFGVPEVWVGSIGALQILALQPDGKYAEAEKSVAFPFLTAAEILGWVSRPQTGNETAWIKELRRWVREVIVPRARGLANDEKRV